MDKLHDFCELLDIESISKIDIAVAFIWAHTKLTTESDCSLTMINQYFEKALLPKYNTTYLKRDLRKNKKVTKGQKSDTYKVVRGTKAEFEKLYGHVFKINSANIITPLDLSKVPLLKDTDLDSAKKMAELYMVIHLYENSARKLIESTLSKALGKQNWWDKAASAGMKRKYSDRKAKEAKNKWLSPRGNNSSPLYYLDWSDLVTIIRKYPQEFSNHVNDIKFVELRFEELEKIRNIVAHNGIIPSEDDFQRVILSFKDWCKQVN